MSTGRSHREAQRRKYDRPRCVAHRPLGQDAEELIRLLSGFQVEVMLADDALGVARLNRCLADGAEFRDEHRNERVPEHVVREPEFLRELHPAFLKVTYDDGESVERVPGHPHSNSH